jgi:DNA-binding response OmpR family regulator
MQSETILVVDDEVAALDFCCTVLTREGYKVLRARNGVEALETHGMAPLVDLALIDVMMPGMNGVELAQRLESTEYPPRISLMSGYSPDEVARLIGGDASRYRIFWKPFEIRIFLQMIRNVLDVPQRQSAFSAGG